MNLNDAKDRMCDIFSMFFQKAAVLFADQQNTQPAPPYISLKVRNYSRNLHQIVTEDGQKVYNCKCMLEANLFTKGRKRTNGKNRTSVYENSALSDMMDFCNFLESDRGTEYLSEHGMTVLLLPPVRDLTELLNESKYRYRSMAEFEVYFTETSNGRYGGNEKEFPNGSGGGTEEMQDASIDGIEEIELSTW